jgi:hypothetical protein
MTQQASSQPASDIPSGFAWSMDIVESADLIGSWVGDANRLLFKLVSEPECEWRQLSGVAS